MRIKRIFLICFVFSGLLALNSLATLYNEMSNLEREAVNEGMAIYGLEPDNHPENKIIEHIYIYTKSPFSQEEGIFGLLNRLHINTKEDVIRRYLLFSAGEPFGPEAIKDSEIYLRKLSSVRSMAIIVPVKNKEDSKNNVDILVVTRDIISLSPSFNFSANNTILTELMVGLSENNFLGYNKSLAAFYEYTQPMHLFSLGYCDPQFLGTNHELMIKPSLVLSRHNLKVDGFLGEFEFKKPLIGRLDKWGYGVQAEFGSKPVIDFSGDRIRTFVPPDIPSKRAIERRYRWSYGQITTEVRRSFGYNHKKEIFLGYGLKIKKPAIPDDLELTSNERESFERNVMPRHERESYISLGGTYFQERYLTLYDCNNFKLQETKRIGPKINLSSDFASTILASDQNFIRPKFKISYLQPLFKQSFLDAWFSTSNRYDGSWSDNSLSGGFTFISPVLPKLGRLVFDTHVASYFNNRDNKKYVLGADSGLRGVTSRFYLGSRAFRANIEFRSLPLEFWIFHVGGVLFYDVGGAFESWDKPKATHALGFGLRILGPQLSAQVFRIDFGFPIYGPGKDYNVMIPSFGLGQAF